jgi:hypothetical protein
MNGMALSFILWQEKGPFGEKKGHGMNELALLFILWQDKK